MMMTLDRLDALETRIRDLVKLVQDLRQKNVSLEEEVKTVRQRLVSEEELTRRWERERSDIQSRIDQVISDIDVLECIDEPEEVSP
jgi:translation initiation factor 2B subunit (eIF-2B alpha/beta/delta family)